MAWRDDGTCEHCGIWGNRAARLKLCICQATNPHLNPEYRAYLLRPGNERSALCVYCGLSIADHVVYPPETKDLGSRGVEVQCRVNVITHNPRRLGTLRSE